MKQNITVHDKEFSVFIEAEQIHRAVGKIAKELSQDMLGKNPLFLCVLNGAFIFASDLLRHITEPCDISFVKFTSYQGTESTGMVKELIGLNENVRDRVVVVIEDIIDTGFTIKSLVEKIYEQGAKEVKVVVLLLKPDSLKVKVQTDYIAFAVAKEFVVGYGLDYDGLGRNYPDIYKVVTQ